MVQVYEEVMEKKSPEESEVEELLGDLNPRYYEEEISAKEAKIRAHALGANANYNFFSAW